jgi:hypothetical protein
MANSVTGNPWRVDTPAVLWTQRFKFDGGTWNAAAASATMTLVDNTGRIVFQAVFPTDLTPVQIPRMGWINGLTCTVLSSGNISIFVGNR